MPSAEAAAAAVSAPTPPPRQGSGTHAAARGASSTAMEFRNVVFNAARDGKLRRLKVRKSTACSFQGVGNWSPLVQSRYGESLFFRAHSKAAWRGGGAEVFDQNLEVECLPRDHFGYDRGLWPPYLRDETIFVKNLAD